MIRAILIFNILLFSATLFAQEITEKDFNRLTGSKSVIYFDDANGKYFGCGLSLDCMGLPVFFYEIRFDKANRRLKISGFVNPNIQGTDTLGTNIFRIFIAKPVKGKLRNIRSLVEVEDTVKTRSEKTTVNIKQLSFKTDFYFSKGDCLYIESGELFKMKEYNISSLLKSRK
jgi:hypothetical protein